MTTSQDTLAEPRDGSGLYYSLLYAEPEARTRFLEQAALNSALSGCLLEVREPTVMQTKVHWWHEELQRLHDGQARHPATQRCQARLSGNEHALQAMLTVLSVAADERLDPADRDDQLLARVRRETNARLQLLAHALCGESTWALAAPLELLATGCGLFERLRSLPGRLHRGFEVFSHERYQRLGCTPADLAAQVRTEGASPRPKMPAAASTLLEEVVDEAVQAYDMAFNHHRASLEGLAEHHAPLITLAMIRRRQLRLWQQRRPALLREWSTLTPINKLFLAWRHKRGLGSSGNP